MSLKKRCLELVLALTSFLPLQNTQAQEIIFENKNLGSVQETKKLEPYTFLSKEYKNISSAVNLIPKETSLDSFVRNNSHLSSYEKVHLLGELGGLAGYRLYDSSDSKKNANEEFMFQKLAESIRSGKNIDVGVCRQIHNFVTQTARKFGMPAVSFTDYYQRGGHVSSAVKIDDKWAIVNYGDVFLSEDANLFSAIDYFQKMDGVTNFQNDFFEGEKLSFRRITPDGETFYDFNIANQINSALYNYIIQKRSVIRDSSLKISNLEKSVLLKKKVFFIKLGAIEGHNSALRTSPLLKLGIHDEVKNDYLDYVIEADLTAAKFVQDKYVDNALIMNFLSENRVNLFTTDFGRFDALLGLDWSTKLNNREKPPNPNYNRIEIGFSLGDEKNREDFAYLIFSGKLSIMDLLNYEKHGLIKEYALGFKKELLKNIGLRINPDINIKPEEMKYSISSELERILRKYRVNLQLSTFFTRTNFENINPEKKGIDLFFQIEKNNQGINAKYSKENYYWPSKDKRESFQISFFKRF